jgi:hypothetical protein
MAIETGRYGEFAADSADKQVATAPINLSGLRLPAPAPARSDVLDTVTLGMYGVFGVLQVLDAHSTLRAIDRGASEFNPVVRPFASSPTALISFKAASSAGVLYLTERLRKKHPVAALAFVIAVNSAQAYVVAQNYRIANSIPRR